MATERIRIRLSPAQADLWDWAVDPTNEFWQPDNPERDGDPGADGWSDNPGYDEACEFARDGYGVMVNDADVADDMIYRLTTQTEHMAIEQGGLDSKGRADAERMDALRQINIGRTIARKIREAIESCRAPALNAPPTSRPTRST